MINCVFRPIADWPRTPTPPHKRKGPRHFQAKQSQTLDLLEYELRQLAAKDIVIEVETTLDQIRNDGWPRSNVKVKGPKVAVSFTSRHGPLRYYCDDCDLWEHNLRCIALTLERLRGAEMYGVTKRGEQYQGFKQLPGGAVILGPHEMTLEEAIIDVCRKGGGNPGLVRQYPDHFKKSYRAAAMACHPDRHPNLLTDWQQLQTAAEILSKHHGLSREDRK